MNLTTLELQAYLTNLILTSELEMTTTHLFIHASLVVQLPIHKDENKILKLQTKSFFDKGIKCNHILFRDFKGYIYIFDKRGTYRMKYVDNLVNKLKHYRPYIVKDTLTLVCINELPIKLQKFPIEKILIKDLFHQDNKFI